ncbi:hypothetical protein [Luteimonas panaciterrae]|uniref:hypothetical protein n=1 Tax=Luteimonas panaciterrae TaxID=363885 RepID=UPI001CFB40CF|nr:hypothetical protein [Luteimonas panaciterrae]
MPRNNDLENNVQNLVEGKLLNLDVTLASMVKGGALSGLDPWDIWCGNGWIVRRWPGPRRFDEFDRAALKELVRTEIGALRQG